MGATVGAEAVGSGACWVGTVAAEVAYEDDAAPEYPSLLPLPAADVSKPE